MPSEVGFATLSVTIQGKNPEPVSSVGEPCIPRTTTVQAAQAAEHRTKNNTSKWRSWSVEHVPQPSQQKNALVAGAAISALGCSPARRQNGQPFRTTRPFSRCETTRHPPGRDASQPSRNLKLHHPQVAFECKILEDGVRRPSGRTHRGMPESPHEDEMVYKTAQEKSEVACGRKTLVGRTCKRGAEPSI